MQPRAHRGHYNFKRTYGFQTAIVGSKPPGSNTASNAKYDSSEKDRSHVQPRAHRGHYIPKEPLGSHATSGSRYTRVPIRSPDLKEETMYSYTTSGSKSSKPPSSNHDLRIRQKNLWIPTSPLGPNLGPMT